MPSTLRFLVGSRIVLAGLLLGGALQMGIALPSGTAAAQAGDATWTARVTGTQGVGLLVRSGPGLEFRVQVALPETSRVQVLLGPQADRQGRAWYLITGWESSGQTGWSAAEYLIPSDGGESGSADTSSSQAPSVRTFAARLTAYSYQTPGGGAQGWMTRTGTAARWGVVAVDPSVVPLGSRVRIEGFDILFVAEDTGGGVRGNHLDIFFPDEAAAVRFGVQYRTVTVVP